VDPTEDPVLVWSPEIGINDYGRMSRLRKRNGKVGGGPRLALGGRGRRDDDCLYLLIDRGEDQVTPYGCRLLQLESFR
jgi:hypothetical protein